MAGLKKFTLRTVAGALVFGAAGLTVDAVLAIDGWWVWGLCAGAIAGALLTFAQESVEA